MNKNYIPKIVFTFVFFIILFISFGVPFISEGTGGLAYGAHQASDTTAAETAGFDIFSESTLPKTNILLLVLLSFSAGILSFLSPCTLPILPAYFAVTFQVDRKKIFFMSLTFFLGLAFLFVLMGASASFFGSMLRRHLFSLTRIGGVIIVVFGCMTFFGKGFSGATFVNRPSSTYVGSFLFGATFALGWTPCIGPILSGILILAASDKTVYQGMMLLLSYSMGLGLPLIIISLLFGKLNKDGIFWRLLKGRGWSFDAGGCSLYLHTTNMASGILLVSLGGLLASGYLTMLNSLIPIGLQQWFNGLEHQILSLF